MKRIISILLTICTLFTICSITGIMAENETSNSIEIILQIDNPNMKVNGTEKPIDAEGSAPVIVNDRTLLPVRAVVEKMGGTVQWNGDTREVTLNYADDEIKLVIDSINAQLNGVNNTLDAAPAIINDRTMLPIRFIAESFKFNVDWKQSTQTIIITKVSKPLPTEEPTATVMPIDGLQIKYPEYFELGTFKGLEVYVWQMAENVYRFGLMQGTNREKTLDEKMELNGATAEEMALILSTFDIEDKDIFVIPWQNPISSYMVTEEMAKDPEYINNIRTMLGLDGVSVSFIGGTDTPIAVEPEGTPAPTEAPSNDNVNSASVIIYFSATGTTKSFAEKIADVTGSDIYEITPTQPYTSADLNYNSDCRANDEQQDDNARPGIEPISANLEAYETIYLGYPIWWGTLPKVIYTFAESCDLSGKTIMPFCTSGSSGISTSVSDLKTLLPNSTVKDGLRGSSSTSNSQIEAWIAE